jgi:hypothetical protein
MNDTWFRVSREHKWHPKTLGPWPCRMANANYLRQTAQPSVHEKRGIILHDECM